MFYSLVYICNSFNISAPQLSYLSSASNVQVIYESKSNHVQVMCKSGTSFKMQVISKLHISQCFKNNCHGLCFLSFLTFFSHFLKAERFFNPVYICISFNISAPVVEVTDCSANGDRDCENNAVNTQCIADVCSRK